MRIVNDIDIDVSRTKRMSVVIAKQYDKESRFLNVTILHDGRKINLDNSMVIAINARRSDGACKSFEGIVNADGTVTVPIDYWMLQYKGRVLCDVSIVVGEDNVLKTTLFDIDVQESAFDPEGIDQDENKDIVVQMLNDTNAAILLAKKASQNADEAAERAIQAAGEVESVKDMLKPEVLDQLKKDAEDAKAAADKAVKSVNGTTPDEAGDVVIEAGGVGRSYTVDNAEKGEIFNDYASNVASGKYSHAEGEKTEASGYTSHTEGYNTKASSTNAHAEGWGTKASGYASHAEGNGTEASNSYAHSEGGNTKATGSSSHAEGDGSKATEFAAHAEGYLTEASGQNAHAEGGYTKASGAKSHAEGYYSEATEANAHAEGYRTVASGNSSHAEGYGSKSIGAYSHAEGSDTESKGSYAHAEGYTTKASSSYQHVQGMYNIEDTEGKFLDIVGNGESGKPSNASTLDKQGNAWFAGDIYVGSNSGMNKDEGSQRLARVEEIPKNLSQLTNDSGFITEHQSLEGYARKTDIPSVAGYVTAEEVSQKILEAIGGIENGAY